MKVTIPFESSLVDELPLDELEITVRNKLGDKVRILCTDGSIPGYPVVGIVEHDDPEDNYLESYTRKGHMFKGDKDNSGDLVIEVDNDAITEKTGVDPRKAARFAAAMFGDPTRYSPKELELITMFSLLATAE